MTNLVSAKNLSYKYPGARDYALNGVSLDIDEGSFFALLGPNGAGKTTLMRLLCGRLPVYTGELNVNPAFRNDDGFLDARACGVLLENPGVYPRLTVAEYLCYFAGFYGMGQNLAKEIGEGILKKLQGPSMSEKLSTLSLGNKQKLQIARALLHNPKVLILDEPVANLDPESREQVWEYIGNWRKETNGTAIVCSHILTEMESVATDYAIIDKGLVLRSGSLLQDNTQGSTNATRYEVELSEPANGEMVRKTLAMAGIAINKVTVRGESLADIYRETVNPQV
jgi:ABC-2 type transport system ATP-binding protein